MLLAAVLSNFAVIAVVRSVVDHVVCDFRKCADDVCCAHRMCDTDVMEIPSCQTAVANPKNRGIWSIGAVGRCLSRQLAENKPLTLECRSLVLVAAPKVCRFCSKISVADF